MTVIIHSADETHIKELEEDAALLISPDTIDHDSVGSVQLTVPHHHLQILYQGTNIKSQAVIGTEGPVKYVHELWITIFPQFKDYLLTNF